MADHPISPTRNSTLEIERIRYSPEWEIPTNYPPRKPESPFLAKLKSLFPNDKPSATSTPPSLTIPTTAIPHHTAPNTVESKETLPPSTSTSTGGSPPPKHPLLDRYFPPEKRYLNHLTRRAFLLLLLLLALILTLALALGLGLGLQHRHRKSQSIPLPWSDAGKGVQQGDLTYYNPSFGLGACGHQSGDNDSVVAVSHELFDAGLDASGTENSNGNVLCGRRIRVWEEGGEEGEKVEVEVEVVDRCTGCEVRDLDLSEGVFGLLVVAVAGGRGRGRVRGGWEWV
ncbi:hypothetical protein QBC36DRAFT_365285 [Triangularia setosa]|uniref:Riboflavin aldehyde-forming enzyme n=1 Tax=Triangularia setosa TaxID=2587417 RepID=A0AAN7A2K4_9PEZI|nr:hypothetical protein QBC36DRAFT_365285 [Podospora setosa]